MSISRGPRVDQLPGNTLKARKKELDLPRHTGTSRARMLDLVLTARGLSLEEPKPPEPKKEEPKKEESKKDEKDGKEKKDDEKGKKP